MGKMIHIWRQEALAVALIISLLTVWVLGEIFFPCCSNKVDWFCFSLFVVIHLLCWTFIWNMGNLGMAHTWLCMMSASTDIPNVAILDLNSTHFLFKPSIFLRGSQSEKSYCLVSDSERNVGLHQGRAQNKGLFYSRRVLECKYGAATLIITPSRCPKESPQQMELHISIWWSCSPPINPGLGLV